MQTLLIANRGEIACRVIRTARAMGLRSVAVYAEPDATALHVESADLAIPLGGVTAAESYLDIEKIIAAARQAGADAIHPGYGFLSENDRFADACAAAGIAFVGPPASAIRAMGDKARSKALMEEAGVPVAPGYHGENQDPAHLAAEADRIGFPVLLKASAGGGGKGMRIVRDAASLPEALAAAQREGASAFGDDRILIEKFVEQARHVEVQVFADSHGQVVHLFDRDCSLQRRNQKILEEAPAPDLAADTRTAMAEAAVTAAASIGYVGAGTVEFLLAQDGAFYFMEMNTRLQVEHPVTEAVTGLDLVEWQLRVARGEPLPLSQAEITCTGHAAEVRLYAEDPARDFLPQAGHIDHLVFPAARDGIRIDTGVRGGDTVTPHYDPMIAKVIAAGADRREALARLDQALAATRLTGLANNLAFLRRMLADADVQAAALHTKLVEARVTDWLAPERAAPSDRERAIAALAVAFARQDRAAEQAATSPWPGSPWHRADGFRLNQRATQTVLLGHGEHESQLTLESLGGADWQVRGPGDALTITAQRLGTDRFLATMNGMSAPVCWRLEGERLTLWLPDRSLSLRAIDRIAQAEGEDVAPGDLTAPMPGKVLAVKVATGDTVTAGQTVLVLEAMKMELAIDAPEAGVVTEILYAAGDQVSDGARLLTITPAEDSAP